MLSPPLRKVLTVGNPPLIGLSPLLPVKLKFGVYAPGPDQDCIKVLILVKYKELNKGIDTNRGRFKLCLYIT